MKKTKKTIKRKKSSKSKNFFTFYNILLLINIILLLGAYYLYTQNKLLNKQLIQSKQTIEILQTKNKQLQKQKKQLTLKYLYEEKTKALEIEYTSHISVNHKKKQKITSKYNFSYKDTFEEPKKIIQKQSNKNILKPNIKQQQVIKQVKPKLAIIIDDISTQHHIDKIKAIGYKVNASFLPPNKSRKYSAIVAHKLDHYMIHLPLQASNNRYDEKKTLHIDDSLRVIENRIKELHKLYPKATFINNHTGSKFTANKEAMRKLYKILEKYNFSFIDSRTTSHSVVNSIAKEYKVKTFSRNIFLDNKKDKDYIIKQLKKAIKIAKQNGSAIAIGHPYNITLDTLKEVKYLLKDLELVYVEQL